MTLKTTNMHKTNKGGLPYYAACLLMACALTGYSSTQTATASIFEKKATEDVETDQAFASLSGFQPNATVSYRVNNPNGSTFNGRAQTDDFGNLTLPMPAEFKNDSAEITYNFIIDEDKNTFNIILMQDSSKGELSVEGSTAQEFTKITIESDEQTLDTQSDWAGLFEEKKINDLWSDKTNEPYKIAFFSTDPARSIEELTRTPTIQIQSAPGGGGPTSSQVNQLNQTNCQNPQISYCQSSMTTQIQNIVDNFVIPMQLMAEQLTHNAMYQAFIIGTFFDAKEQLEVERDIQALTAEAHRDYHPSEQLCRFGSFTKSLATTDQKIYAEKLAINTVLNDYYLNKKNTSSSFGEVGAAETRLQQFRTTYCDVSNNNNQLSTLCDHDQDPSTTGTGATDHLRTNKDIDILRTYDAKYTLDVDFTDNTVTEDEEDIIALAKNLYWPRTFLSATDTDKNSYMDARRVVSITNVAHNSYANQVALKASAPDVDPTSADPKNTGWAHMKTMMREFGIDDAGIVALLGEQPSYYAQMDILTKKIYQSPDFYTNLYSGTANIDRINATLDAISLMQQRDHYQTLLRQEMLTSSMVQTELAPTIDRVNISIQKGE